ncbi:hypothetical protein, partial [Burkholderia sp. BCCCDS19]|uniref:hypothetical protein n=1 Tax=Burkholderia sp. BCCCDS19 TaxID=3390246 RepID=UPI003D2EEF08
REAPDDRLLNERRAHGGGMRTVPRRASCRASRVMRVVVARRCTTFGKRMNRDVQFSSLPSTR